MGDQFWRSRSFALRRAIYILQSELRIVNYYFLYPHNQLANNFVNIHPINLDSDVQRAIDNNDHIDSLVKIWIGLHHILRPLFPSINGSVGMIRLDVVQFV